MLNKEVNIGALLMKFLAFPRILRASAAFLSLALVTSTPLTASPVEAQTPRLEEAITDYRLGNYGRAFQSFARLADRGDADAAFWTGLMWQKGLGVAKNRQEALRYYEMGARAGDPRAMNNLGLLLASQPGRGGNLVDIYAWFLLAADQNQLAAIENRNNLEVELTPLQRAAGKTLALRRQMEIDQRFLDPDFVGDAPTLASGGRSTSGPLPGIETASVQSTLRTPRTRTETGTETGTTQDALIAAVHRAASGAELNSSATAPSQPRVLAQREEAPATSVPAPNPAANSTQEQVASLPQASLPQASLPQPSSAGPQKSQAESLVLPAGRFEVQIGVFRDQANVQRLTTQAKSLGFGVRQKPMQVNGTQVTAIRVGPFVQESDARLAAKKLEGILGIKTILKSDALDG